MDHSGEDILASNAPSLSPGFIRSFQLGESERLFFTCLHDDGVASTRVYFRALREV